MRIKAIAVFCALQCKKDKDYLHKKQDAAAISPLNIGLKVWKGIFRCFKWYIDNERFLQKHLII